MKALCAIYDAFYPSPNKTSKQFSAIELACKVLGNREHKEIK